jgi:Ca2+-binding RTX toxin-like protein
MGALFGGTDTAPHRTVHSSDVALLDGQATSGGTITGRYGVDVRAFHDAVTVEVDEHSACYCIGPSSHSGSTNFQIDASAIGHHGVTVYAGPRIVRCTGSNASTCNAAQGGAASPLVVVDSANARNLVLYVQAENPTPPTDKGDHIGGGDQARTVDWNSDVVVNAGPDPYLLVDADGYVVDAINVTVNGTKDPAVGTQYTGPIDVGDIANAGSGDIWMTSAGGTVEGGVSESGHFWGTFTFHQNFRTVALLNNSAQDLIVNRIDVINATGRPNVTLTTGGGNVTMKFDIVQDVSPSLVVIDNTGDSDVTLAGTVNNPLGETDVHATQGNILAATGRATPTDVHTTLVTSNVLHLDAEAGSVGSATHRVVIDLVAYAAHPVEFSVTAGVDAYLDLRTWVRDPSGPDLTQAATAPYVVTIDSLVAGNDLDVLLRATLYGPARAALPGVAVHAFDSPDPSGTYWTFYWPDNPSCPSGTTNTQCLFDAGAVGDPGSTAVKSTYDFATLDSGSSTANGSVVVAAADTSPTATRINVIGLVSVHQNGNVNVDTNGFVTLTETAADSTARRVVVDQAVSPVVTGFVTIRDVTVAVGQLDLRAGLVRSTDDDVTLTSPASIVDAPVGTPIPPPTGDAAADVVGVDITMFANNGTIGSDTNFLEIDSSVDRFGVLAAHATGVIRVTETAGNLDVDLVTTCYGSSQSSCADISLASDSGSIIDGHNGGLGGTTVNVEGNTVDLWADGGSIGLADGTSDLKINSDKGNAALTTFTLKYQHDASPATSHQYADATDAERTVSARYHVAAQASQSIYLTELDGSMNVLLAHASAGNVRLTTTETAVEGNDILLLDTGSTLVVENAPQAVPHGLVEADGGNVLLQAADDVVTDKGSTITTTNTGAVPTDPFGTTDPNQPVTTSGNIDIHGDWHPGVADATADEGTVIVLRGSVTPGAGGLTRVFGNADADKIVLDQTYLGGYTRVYGSATATQPNAYSTTADGEDTIVVYKLQSMTVGQVTLDGQAGTDHYEIWTHGTQAGDFHYVVNVLDSGAPADGVDTLTVYGADGTSTLLTDDVVLLRAASWLPGESQWRPTLYCGYAAGTGCADRPGYVAVLHPVVAPGQDAGEAATESQYAGSFERVAYDGGINGRLTVATLGGNDLFAVDDNAAPTTLDGGAGSDRFQVGQVYGMRRDDPTSGLSPPDYFPTIATTRGYLSEGTSAPLVAQGGSGDDEFTVYSNHATLRLEGDEGNDLFTVQAFALAKVHANGDLVMGPGFTGVVTVLSTTSTITRSDGGSFLDDGFAVGQTLVVKGAGAGNDNTAGTAYVIKAVTASTITLDRELTTVPPLLTSGTFTVSLSSGPLSRPTGSAALTIGNVDGHGTITRNDGGSFVDDGFLPGLALALLGTGLNDNLSGAPYFVTGVTATTITVAQALTPGTFTGATVSAVLPTPALTNGFSTSSQTDILTGAGQNQVQYNVNAPVSVDGGTGFNKLVILGTEFADHIVVTDHGIFGAGIQVTFRNVQVIEVDALQGDDTIDVLSTPPNVVVRVLGGIGSDVINVAGDVVGDVVSKDINGTSTTINHLIVSDDAAYAHTVAPGVSVSVARPTQGAVVITETGGFTSVQRLSNGLTIGTTDSYSVVLSSQPTSDVWVSVTAALSPLADQPGADTVYVCTGTAAQCTGPNAYFRTVHLDGTSTPLANRALVLHFTTTNWDVPQLLWVAAANDTTPQGTIVVAVSHFVQSADPLFDHAVVRNVEVTVVDNLTPAVVITQLDHSGAPDTSTTVIKGTATTQLTDRFTLTLPSAPSGTVTVIITPNDNRLLLAANHTDRFHLGAVVDGIQTWVATFDAGNFDDPLVITVTAKNTFTVEDPTYTVLVLSVDDTTGPGRDTAYDDVIGRLDVLVHDDHAPGVYVEESGGSTLVTVPASGPGTSDTYTMRLLSRPSATVTIRFVTDGETTIDTSHCATTRVCLDATGAYVTFDTTNWWMPVTVTITGNPDFVVPVGQDDKMLFPKTPHLLSAIRGPLEVDGGTAGEHHTLTSAVILPHEVNTAPFGIAQQPSEARQVDVLNIFDDGGHASRVGATAGVLTSTTLTGLGMGPGDSFPGGTAFGEPSSVPSGITYGSIAVQRDGDGTVVGYSTDGSRTTIEVLNVMLGQGNDDLTVESTMIPGPDQATDDKLPTGIPSLHGGITVVQGGGDKLLELTGTYVLTATTIRRTDGLPWAADGFVVGQRITVPGYAAGSLTIAAVSGDTLTVTGGTLTPGTIGTDDDPVTISVFDPAATATGQVRVGGDTITVLAGGGQGNGSPGPLSPLVVNGDTSQDGVWYSGDPTHQTVRNFGPKPTTEPVGNSPDFYFPVAQGFELFGNDVIDASAVDAGLLPGDLPTIGVTLYGGPGDDTITGSQAGDILAGGSGNDLVHGQGGNDLVYGDSGVNVDVITRVLTVPTTTTTSVCNTLDGVAVHCPNEDGLVAGHDVIQGEGGDDVVFGDHGKVVQDVQDVRVWLQDPSGAFTLTDPRLQRIQTTGVLQHLQTVEQANGLGDTITGDDGNDLLLGGGGGDTIYGYAGNDLAFGDFGSVDCTQLLGDVPAVGYNPLCRIDPTRLPLDVPLNDHTFTWTSLDTQAGANWGNDLVGGGDGLDILVGGAGSDRITGGNGDDDIIGGNTGLALAGVANSGGAGGWNAGVDYSGGHVAYGDTFDNTGGFDGGHSACLTAAACTYGDFLDGGTGNDVVAGDNATILRTGSTYSPRFRVLTGSDVFDTTNGADNSLGTELVPGTLPSQWVDTTSGALTTAPANTDYGYQADPRGAHVRYVTLYDHSDTAAPGTSSDSAIAGGAGDDVLFGQLGTDWIQGDGSVVDDFGHVTIDVLTRDPVGDLRRSIADFGGVGTDGNDYVEGNGGNDVIYGDLGQDDLVGGSSSMFGLSTPSMRPDGADAIYGGAGTLVGLDDNGDLSATGHAHDADVVLGDNGNIHRLVGAFGSPTTDAYGATKAAPAFLTFTYDTYSTAERVIPRAYTLLDYTVGTAAATDRGGADLVHGEGSDDVIHGELGSDVLAGDGQDDTIIGGTGNDRVYGGSGDDRILGDDGYFKIVRNGLTEPLFDFATAHATDVLEAMPGPYTQALTFNTGALYVEGRLLGYDPEPSHTTYAPYADIVWGGLGNDWVHGGAGDDAISGASPLAFYYSDVPQAAIQGLWGISPVDPLAYDPATTKFADYNAENPWAKVFDCTSGQKDIGLTGTCASGQKVEFFLNFTPYVLDASGTPILDGTAQPVKSDDGCDIIYGDNGNDWTVGGTDTNWLFGGFGDDLLQSSQDLDVDGGVNRVPEPERWSDPTFAYGGAGRDVLIADTGRARMFDWHGEFNSFVVPFSPFGTPVVNRTFSPWARDFIRALAAAGGQDPTFVPGSPIDELSLTEPQDPYYHDQEGGPRDPQPGNVPGVQIDYRGLVDLGANCPCHNGLVATVEGAVNAANPLSPTDLEDADTTPGRVLLIGAPVVLTYLVSTPGTVDLQVDSITDDDGTAGAPADDFHPVYVSGDNNDNGLLDPGETWLYTATGVAGAPTTVVAGTHDHVVVLVAHDPAAPTGTAATASDPTSWSGSLSRVSIGKDLNAADPLTPTTVERADTQGTAPHLGVGAPLVFTYRVGNGGTTPLTVVSVVDDNATPADPSDDFAPVYVSGDANHNSLLDPGETWLYSSAGVPGAPTKAMAGWHHNIATVTATDAAGTYLATDLAWYFGSTGLELVKAVNAVDPFHPTAPEDANSAPVRVAVGVPVTFTYLVTNVSGAAMSVTDLVDDNGTPTIPGDDVSLVGGQIAPRLQADGVHNLGDLDSNGLLDPGEAWLYAWTTVARLGTFTNTAAVTAQTTAGGTASAQDLAMVTGAPASVVIQTAVNALHPLAPAAYEDADSAPGRYVTTGSTEVFTYLVTNDGPLPLSDVTVTDNRGTSSTADDFHPAYVSGDDGNGLLDPGETWLYTSAGVAGAPTTVVAGLYSDVSSVVATPVATPAQAPVTSTDPTYVTGVPVGVGVAKAVNAASPLAPSVVEDANDPTSPYAVLTGSPVVFTYLVTTTLQSGPARAAIVLTDDNGTAATADDFHPAYVSGDNNGNGVLDKNETWLYASTTRTALAGTQCNQVALVTTVSGKTYAAQDVACYQGITPKVTIKKATNAVDPFHPTLDEEGDTTAHQLYLAPGTPILWTYRVMTSGDVAVRVSGIVDDFGTPNNPTDDFAPTPVLVAGFNIGDTNHDNLLEPGEVWLFTCDGVRTYAVRPGQFKSHATVTAVEPRTGTQVSSTDASDHFGAAVRLLVTKAVNAADPRHPTAYEDANYAPGPILPVGSTVTWTYLVTNVGSTSLDVTGLTDDGGCGPTPASGCTGFDVTDLVDGDTNGNGMLDPGETWLYRATGTVAPGQYTNVVIACATTSGVPTPADVTATDVANSFGTVADPGISVTKRLGGRIARTPATQVLLAVGTTAAYTYEVTATKPLADVSVTDDNGTPGDASDDTHPASVLAGDGLHNVGDTNADGILDPGETWLYSGSRVVTAGPYANVVRVSGADVATGTTVWDDDISYSLGVVTKVTIVKAVNALDPWHPTGIEDANTQPAKELLVGSTAVWTYLVTNTGNAPVSLTSLVDDNGTPTVTSDDFVPVGVTVTFDGATYNAGDLDHDNLIDVGETWLFEGSSVVHAGLYLNTATVVVTQPSVHTTATASDVAGYYGDGTAEGLTPGFWKNRLDMWPTNPDGSLVWDPYQLVSTVFGPLPAAEADETFLDALGNGGGGVDALLRHAVSALISSTDQYLAYPQSATWLVQAVNAALASGDATQITNLQNLLAGWNNAEGSLTPPVIGPPSLAITGASVTEGNSGTTTALLTVTLSSASLSTVTVNWATADGTATAGSDYLPASGTLTFGPGQVSLTISVTVNGDTVFEPDEAFTVTLSGPVGATLGTSTGSVTISNDDAAPVPSLSISDGTAAVVRNKTTTVTLTVTLSAPSTSTVTVGVATADGTAKAGTDYTALSTTLTFSPGQTSKTVTITIRAHATGSLTKTFTVVLSSPTNATLLDGIGTVSLTGTSGLEAVGTPTTSYAAPLTTRTLATVARAATDAWVAAGYAHSLLSGVQFVIADLPGDLLATTSGHTITVDATAAGFGWFTGVSSEDFTGTGLDLAALPGTTAYGRIDLLTVLTHELGHILGFEHGTSAETGDVMLASLPAGTRRLLPSADVVHGDAKAASSSTTLATDPQLSSAAQLSSPASPQLTDGQEATAGPPGREAAATTR